VVLHRRDDDLVAGLQARAQERVGHQVDGLRRAAGKDDLLATLGADESLDFVARRLVGLGCALRQEVDAAVDVGVVRLVEVGDGVEDLARLLRRRGVVQVDQGLAVHVLLQRREVLPDLGGVELGGLRSLPAH
jgi:hypothetical protein